MDLKNGYVFCNSHTLYFPMYRYDQNNLNSFYYDLRQLFSNLIFYTMYPVKA